jgi:hypothetical protein
MYTLYNNIVSDILFYSGICVDFLGTHMISLVLFFRKPGVTCGSPTHTNGRERSVYARNSKPLPGYSSAGMGASAAMVRRLAGEGIRLGFPSLSSSSNLSPFLSSRARVLPLLSLSYTRKFFQVVSHFYMWYQSYKTIVLQVILNFK